LVIVINLYLKNLSGVGAFAFAPIADILMKKLGWQYSMVVMGGCFLMCCLFGAVLRPVPTKIPDQRFEMTERFSYFFNFK
jgi:hypothetical protein